METFFHARFKQFILYGIIPGIPKAEAGAINMHFLIFILINDSFIKKGKRNEATKERKENIQA